VLRVWFDKQLEGPEAREVVLETPQASMVNLVAQYHLLEDECMQWANETGGSGPSPYRSLWDTLLIRPAVVAGSIMEFHLYTWRQGNVRDDEVWPLVRPELCGAILPEVCQRDFQALATHVGTYKVGVLDLRRWGRSSLARWRTGLPVVQEGVEQVPARGRDATPPGGRTDDERLSGW
jgi:hypothetical protein